MIITLPTGDVVDTGAGWISFGSTNANPVPSSPTLSLNSNVIYTAQSIAEWYALKVKVGAALATGTTAINLQSLAPPTLTAVSPSPYSLSSGGGTIALTGTGIVPGCTGSIEMPGLNGSGIPVAQIVFQVLYTGTTPTGASFSVPALGTTGSATITLINPDGGVATIGVTISS